jgi:DNA-binding transcriptional LysR family regulator
MQDGCEPRGVPRADGAAEIAAPPLAWNELRLVLEVLRAGGLGRAAAALGIDATNVGRKLARLNERLERPLFERVEGVLVPTPSARALLADLEAMEALAWSIEQKLAAEPAAGRARVRLATSESFAMYWLLGRLEALRARVPDAELEIVASHALADLRRREADVALRFVRPVGRDLRVRRVGAIRWSLYASPSYLARSPRLELERGLAGQEIVRWGGPPLRPRVAAWLDEHATEARVALVSPHLHLMIEACAAGLGLALLPGAMALGHGGLERVIDHAVDESEVWLVVHRDLRRTPRVRAVADALAARLLEERESLRAM